MVTRGRKQAKTKGRLAKKRLGKVRVKRVRKGLKSHATQARQS